MTDDPPPTPVPYAPPPPPPTRGQMRALLLLSLINTALLGAFVLGPALTAFARQQWTDYQQHRARATADAQAAAVRRSFLPAQRQCLDYSLPAATLVYAEDADGIARLTAAGPINPIAMTGGSNRPTELATLPLGAANPSFLANMPTSLAILHVSNSTFVYLHSNTTVAGERLVAVDVWGHQEVETENPMKYTGWNGLLTTSRTLRATVLRPMTPGAEAEVLSQDELNLQAGAVLFTVDNSKTPHVVTADDGGHLRLFAGQPDPTDPARFHLPYTLDGVAGTIEGRLTPDDHVQLTPDRRLADLEAAAEAHPPTVPPVAQRRATGKPR